MADFNKTASAASQLQITPSDISTVEAYSLALTRGLEKVWARDYDPLMEMMKFVREEDTRFESGTLRTYRGLDGVISQNRDTDDMPYKQGGEGFAITYNTYNYRGAIAFDRTMQEVEDRGIVKKLQGDLVKKARLTLEEAIADIFNRGVNPTNAPILADDGMYLVDTARPNANPKAAAWSNQETAAAITPSSIYTAQLNAAATLDENGDAIDPQMISTIWARPQDEKVLWEIAKSDLRPTDAMNARNFQVGRFEIGIMRRLTDAAIFYQMSDMKGDDNELVLKWREHPAQFAWQDGSNPDIFRQRVRFAFGFQLGSPRRTWRGGEVV